MFKKLSPAHKSLIKEMIRVNHAGEIGANSIYAGQSLFINQSHKHLIQQMWDQEKLHLQKFDSLISETRTRPTALRPLWEAMGYSIGAASALLGTKSAMALTEAVETVIGNHYNDQLRQLLEIDDELGELTELKKVIQEFRDDELEHLDTAVQNEAKDAPFYELFGALVQGGCWVAIQVAKKI